MKVTEQDQSGWLPQDVATFLPGPSVLALQVICMLCPWPGLLCAVSMSSRKWCFILKVACLNIYK